MQLQLRKWRKKKVKKKINIPINLTSISYHMDPIRHEIKVSLFLQRTNIIQLSSQNRTTTQVNQVHTILKGTLFSTTNGWPNLHSTCLWTNSIMQDDYPAKIQAHPSTTFLPKENFSFFKSLMNKNTDSFMIDNWICCKSPGILPYMLLNKKKI